MRNFNHLTKTQRLQLEAYLKIKMPKKEIANLLGVHISTIYREIKRGEYQHLKSDLTTEIRYSSDMAESKYRNYLKAKGQDLKIDKDFKLASYIEKRIIEDKLSPLAVLGEIKAKHLKFKTSICVNTLYSYIYKGIFERLEMKHLTFKERKKRYKHLEQKRAPRGTSIEKRPDEINKRNTFGHWEMDCVCGSTKTTLLVLTERLTRKEIIRIMPNQDTKSVLAELNKLEKQFGCKRFKEIFKSITTDNGTEFADYEGITTSIYTKTPRTKVYYCHAYCSWEKGTCERINREIRRLIPKGSNLSNYSFDDIQFVENWVNNYPRQVLNFFNSNDLFKQYTI